MAWTTPRTWSSGELVAAAIMNEQMRDNQNVLKAAVDNNGKIVALNSTYLASTDASGLTGIALLAANNDFSAGTHNFNAGAGTRLVIPVGTNRWST